MDGKATRGRPADLGEAVQQAAGGLRVEEGHREADDLGQQAAVERARRVVGAEHDEDAAHEGKHQGPAAQRKVDRHVVPVVGLGAGAAGCVGPHREPEVLANLRHGGAHSSGYPS